MKVYYKAATNTNDAKSGFNARKDYSKIHAYATDTGNPKKAIRHVDLLANFPLYGKVDYKGKAVYVLPENSMDVLKANKIIHCVNFVKDAFDDFREYYNRLYERGMMGDVGELTTIEAVSGYVSPMVSYEQNLTRMKKFFLSEIAYPDSNSITDVKDFMHKMAQEMLRQCKDFPITLSSHVLSPHCSSKTTGLIIDIMDAPRGDDKKKLQMVFSDNYQKYVAIATRFGFRVDARAPWSLVADLGSYRMFQYMLPYGVNTATQYFKEYCVHTYFEDLKRIKNLFYDTYYEFVTNIKFRRVEPKCPDTGVPKSKAAEYFRRDQHLIEDLDGMFGDKYWLDFYMKARYNELNINILDSIKTEMYDKINFIYSQRGLKPALKHACSYFDLLNVENYKLANTIPVSMDIEQYAGYLDPEEENMESNLEYQYQPTEGFMEEDDWWEWNDREYDDEY